MDMMGGGWIWFGLLMMLFGLLVLVGIILLAVWAIARFAGNERQRSNTTSGSPVDPLTILQRRYARGEITREGYERIRPDLKGREVYVTRTSGDLGPEMGPNMMWDSQYGMMGATCATPRTESDARAGAARATSIALGDGEQHHGYWEFELKKGGAVVNQINVQDCTGAVINEQQWQPDMQGTYAPSA